MFCSFQFSFHHGLISLSLWINSYFAIQSLDNSLSLFYIYIVSFLYLYVFDALFSWLYILLSVPSSVHFMCTQCGLLAFTIGSSYHIALPVSLSSTTFCLFVIALPCLIPPVGMYQCHKKLCLTCKHVNHSQKKFTNKGKTYLRSKFFNRSIEFVVYCLICPCGLHYERGLGSTAVS